MLRNLLTGRYRSMGVPQQGGGSAPTPYLLRTTGANPTFDPGITRNAGAAPTWDMGDTTTYPTTDAISHSYASAGDYEVRWDIDPAVLTHTRFGNDDITEFNTDIAWVDLIQLNISTNPGLGSIDTYKEWVALEEVTLNNTGLSVFETHVEWTALTSISIDVNSLTSLTTYAAWILLGSIQIDHNAGLTGLTVHSAWTAFWFLWMHDCDLSAATIDAILIALDASGKINGNLKYENNPGSADGARSGAATTAKANLVTKGWSITN